jgi:hypothetical protein
VENNLYQLVLAVGIFLRFLQNFYDFLRLLEVGYKSLPMDYHSGKNVGNVGYKSTPGTPISVNFGQPLGPQIGQNRYPTSWGIIRGLEYSYHFRPGPARHVHYLTRRFVFFFFFKWGT